MGDLITYLKNKRERHGPCNICMVESPLTWDHVPPQGGTDLTRVEMESLLSRIAAEKPEKQLRISQNGVKYRTLCSSCNSELGARYDPTIIQFTNDVGQFLKSSLSFPKFIHIKTRPTALMRAIIGHLLAASISPVSGLGSKNLGSFVLDETALLPRGISVFYWLYPYTSVSVVRDIGMNAVRGSFRAVGLFNLLKFFPIAYLVTDLEQYEGLQELSAFRQHPSTYEVEVPIDLTSAKDPRWPDLVEDGNIIAGGESLQSSLYATPK